jgi:hypothetical protein
MKSRSLILAMMLAFSVSAANAGNFVTLGTGNGTTLTPGNGGLRNGAQNPNADIYRIEVTSATYLPGLDSTSPTGDIVADVINYQTFNRVGTTNVPTGTGTLTLLDWRVSTAVDLSPGTAQADIYDFVYRDSSDNSLVFATRYLNRQANNEEANYLFRYNYTTTAGYQPGTAWLFSSDNDLRMYQAALTDDISFDNAVPYVDGVVRQKGDFSVSEGNPWSGLFLVKTDAKYYFYSDDIKAIGFAQAGEEGQPVVNGWIGGFVASAVPVPEPENYALMMLGLGVIGAMVRRQKKQA